jgi:hypothetical protein
MGAVKVQKDRKNAMNRNNKRVAVKQMGESDQIDTTQSQPAEHGDAAGTASAAKTADAASSSLMHDEPTETTELVNLDQPTEEIEQKTAPEQIGDTKGTDAAPTQPPAMDRMPLGKATPDAEPEQQPGAPVANLQMGCASCELWNARDRRDCYAGSMTFRFAGRSGWPMALDQALLFLHRVDTALRWSDLRGKGRFNKSWLNGLRCVGTTKVMGTLKME